jgi:hypothetical protein
MSATQDSSPPVPLPCARCGVVIERGRVESYIVEIRAVADPCPTVFTDDDLARDTEAAIGELLRRLYKMTETQLVDQVYRRRLFCLCSECYGRWMSDPFGTSPGASST